MTRIAAGPAGADLAGLVRSACSFAAARALERSGGPAGVSAAALLVTAEDIGRALVEVVGGRRPVGFGGLRASVRRRVRRWQLRDGPPAILAGVFVELSGAIAR